MSTTLQQFTTFQKCKAQENRSINKYTRAGVRKYKNRSTAAHQYIETGVHKYRSTVVLVHRYRCSQEQKYSSALVHGNRCVFKNRRTVVHQYTETQVCIQEQEYSITLVHGNNFVYKYMSTVEQQCIKTGVYTYMYRRTVVNQYMETGVYTCTGEQEYTSAQKQVCIQVQSYSSTLVHRNRFVYKYIYKLSIKEMFNILITRISMVLNLPQYTFQVF